jgi:hypothetical protein
MQQQELLARRLKAVLALRGRTFAQLAGSLGISERHLRNQLDGRRLSPRLFDALQRELGEAWAFCVGRVAALTDIESHTSEVPHVD